jgi:cullin 3
MNRAKKTLSHENLIVETINQLTSHFKPQVSMLKDRIGLLIEREYLERIEDEGPPAYKYLA